MDLDLDLSSDLGAEVVTNGAAAVDHVVDDGEQDIDSISSSLHKTHLIDPVDAEDVAVDIVEHPISDAQEEEADQEFSQNEVEEADQEFAQNEEDNANSSASEEEAPLSEPEIGLESPDIMLEEPELALEEANEPEFGQEADAEPEYGLEVNAEPEFGLEAEAELEFAEPNLPTEEEVTSPMDSGIVSEEATDEPLPVSPDCDKPIVIDELQFKNAASASKLYGVFD